LNITQALYGKVFFSAKRVVKTGAGWKTGSSVDIHIFDATWLRDGVSISSEGQP